MATSPSLIGTLVVVILKARNLPNKRRIGKQSPYCTISFNGEKRRTKAIHRGGQHPEWDEEVRLDLLEEDLADVPRIDGPGPPPLPPKPGLLLPPNKRKIKGGQQLHLSVYADDPLKPDLVGDVMVDLTEVLTRGERDEWFPLKCKDRYSGEIFLEMTFYSNEPEPVKNKKPKEIKPKNHGAASFFSPGSNFSPRPAFASNEEGTMLNWIPSAASSMSPLPSSLLSPSMPPTDTDLHIDPYEALKTSTVSSWASWSPPSVDSLTSAFGLIGVADHQMIASVLTGETLPEDVNSERAVDIFQMWLDDNNVHPQRHLLIKKLVDFASENHHNLPAALFISGVYIDRDAAPVAGGSFADVFRGNYVGQDVAVKRFRMFVSEDERDKIYKRFYREALIWRQLRHPRVLAFLGVDKDALGWKGSLNMVSPWMAQGTLMEYLRQLNSSPTSQKLLIMDVATGLAYLHAHTFAHGDLHGANVFIDGQGRALLGDFGLTAVTDMAHLAASTTINKAGAIRWLAPELVHYEEGPPPRKTMSGDVFAFGRICLSVYTRSAPFHLIASDAGIVMKVMAHWHPSKPTPDECHGARLPDELWDVIIQCWSSDPNGRPAIGDIVAYLNGIYF